VMEQLGLIGFTLDVVGKVLVAFMAIRVHHRVWQEHKVDGVVFKAMKKEQGLGFLGIGMMVMGYLLQLPDKLL
jgi:rRNA processing protein Gar1